MDYTIIVRDRVVYVDGVPRVLAKVDIPDDVQAVRWDGTKGEIEYRVTANGKRQNASFDSADQFQSVIDAWHAWQPPAPPAPIAPPGPLVVDPPMDSIPASE